MESLTGIKELSNRYPLSSYIPLLAHIPDENLYITEEGIGFVFICDPIQGADNLVSMGIKSILETQFPPKSSVQFMLLCSGEIDPMLDLYVFMRENYGNPLMIELAKKKRDFLKQGTTGSICKGFKQRVRDFKLLVSVVIPCKPTPDSYVDGISRTKKYKEFIFSTLKSINILPREVAADEFIRILAEIINPSHKEDFKHLSWDPKTAIADQLVFSDNITEVYKDYLLLDGKYCRSFTVRQYPPEWDISSCVNYVGDFFENARQLDSIPFFISMNCEHVSPVQTVSKIKTKALSVGYQAFGPMAKWIPKVAMKKQEFDKFVMMLEDGASPIYGYLHIMIYANDLKELEEYTGQVLTLYRSLGFTLQKDDLIGLPLFLQSIPLGYIPEAQNFLMRRKTFTTHNVAELAPLQAEWKGFGQPAFFLIGRRGQLQHFNLFDNPAGGYSAVVVASTGSGKSFFVNEIIYSYLSIGAKLWVIDIGRSYEKLCNLFNGEFIVFGKDTKINLNPFTFIESIDEEMTILKDIVSQMASKTPLDDLSKSYIESAISQVFAEKGNKTTITDVARALLSMEDSRAKDIGTMLFPYTMQGAYADYFEGDANISFKTNFTVLELEELKTKTDLRDVVLLALIYQIQREIAMDRTQMKILIIDEAWDLLTGGNVSNFIEASYRRFRKYKGSCITVTQSVNDFHRIPAGVAIIENADFLFLLRQRAESIEALKQTQRVALSNYYFDLLKSLKTDVGNYSEIFVYTPVGVTVGKLIVDRFTQLLYSSKADEYTKIKSYIDRGYDVIKAIEAVMAEEENLK